MYFLNLGSVINPVLVLYCYDRMSEGKRRTRISVGSWFEGHSLSWSGRYSSEQLFGLGNQSLKCNISVALDQVLSAFEELHLPVRPHVLKSSTNAQNSATNRGLSLQMHEPVGTKLTNVTRKQ